MAEALARVHRSNDLPGVRGPLARALRLVLRLVR
jgi:hypothetical protein